MKVILIRSDFLILLNTEQLVVVPVRDNVDEAVSSIGLQELSHLKSDQLSLCQPVIYFQVYFVCQWFELWREGGEKL